MIRLGRVLSYRLPTCVDNLWLFVHNRNVLHERYSVLGLHRVGVAELVQMVGFGWTTLSLTNEQLALEGRLWTPVMVYLGSYHWCIRSAVHAISFEYCYKMYLS